MYDGNSLRRFTTSRKCLGLLWSKWQSSSTKEPGQALVARLIFSTASLGGLGSYLSSHDGPLREPELWNTSSVAAPANPRIVSTTAFAATSPDIS
jgi:hypothetical protein